MRKLPPGARPLPPRPCPDCGVVTRNRRREGHYSVCAECGGDRYRVVLTAELSSAIDAYHDGTGTAEQVVTESFNQQFTDIVEGQ